MNLLRKKLIPLGPKPLTVLSAALIVIAFPPWDISPLIWIALVPWLIQLDGSLCVRSALKEGFWLCVLMTLGGYYWVASVLEHFGNLPWALAVLGVLVFSTFNQLQFIIFAPVYVGTRRWFPEKWRFLYYALIYAAIDTLTPKLFRDTLGHSQYNLDWLRQIADLSGIQLLTFLIVLHNLALKDLWKNTQHKRTAYGFSLLLLIAGMTYGVLRSSQVQSIQAAADKHITLGLIQPGIGDIDKLAAKAGNHYLAAQKIMENLEELSVAASKDPGPQGTGPDAIVWPETSYPNLFRKPRSPFDVVLDNWVMKILEQIKRPLLFGGYDRTRDPDKEYNAFYFLTPQDHPKIGDLQVYRKSVLLPFGEFIPGADYVPWIKDQFPQVGYFGRGNGAEVFTVPHERGDLVFNPIICYEALFPSFIRDAALQGSRFILNITNDSWFGPYGEPYLHLALSTFRGVEVRLPQVRSTNTGISVLVDSRGQISQRMDVGQRGYVNVTFPIHDPIGSLYLKWGDWFSFLIVIASAILLLPKFFRRIGPHRDDQ